jgi:hypothetical protein
VLTGRDRLATLLKAGKELKVFALKEADLNAFCAEARRFGVGYYVVRGHKKQLDGLCDIMVPAEQASMVARIVERFGYQPTDRATLQAKAERDRGVQTKDEVDRMLDEALGAPQQKEKPAADFQKGPSEDSAKRTGGYETRSVSPRTRSVPTAGGHRATGLEPRLNSGEASNRTTPNKKPSVKERLDTIAASLKRKTPDRAAPRQQPPKSRKEKKGTKSHGK